MGTHPPTHTRVGDTTAWELVTHRVGTRLSVCARVPCLLYREGRRWRVFIVDQAQEAYCHTAAVLPPMACPLLPSGRKRLDRKTGCRAAENARFPRLTSPTAPSSNRESPAPPRHGWQCLTGDRQQGGGCGKDSCKGEQVRGLVEVRCTGRPVAGSGMHPPQMQTPTQRFAENDV